MICKAYYKNKSTISWKSTIGGFAYISLRYLSKLQQDIEDGLVSRISLTKEDGTVIIKRGLKSFYFPNWRNYSENRWEKID